MRIQRTKNLVTIAASIVAYLLLTSALSWAEVKLIVVRNTATNALKATVCDSSQAVPCVAVTVPTGTNFTSSLLPTLGWDQTINNGGGWTIAGINGSNLTTWYGDIMRNAGSTVGYSFLLLGGIPDSVVTGTGQQLEQVVYEAPELCKSYTYACIGTCPSSGTCPAVVTGSYPAFCSGGIAPATTQPCAYVPPQCTSYTYTLGTCQSTNTAPVTGYTGIPASCSGGAVPATTQPCVYVPPQCTSYTYTLGTCQSTNTAPVTGYTGIPAGCSGGAVPATTQPCTYGVACTDYSYSAWGVCTNNSQSRTVTGNIPAGCTGTPPVPQVLTQTGCGTTNNYTTLLSGADVRNDNIAPNGGEAYYQFTVDQAHAGHTPTIQLISTDQTTLQLMVVKEGTSFVTRKDFDSLWNSGSKIGVAPPYWYRFFGSGVGTQSSYSSYAISIYNVQPDTYSVIVVNTSPIAGSYRITYYMP